MPYVRYFNCYPHDPEEPDVVYVTANNPHEVFKEHLGFYPSYVDPHIRDQKYGIIDILTQESFIYSSQKDLEVGW